MHLKLINKNGLLIVSIIEALHILGIPKMGKVSKIILIYKKGFIADLAHLRSTCLLNILYKLYSGITSSKLIFVSKENS